MRLEQIVLVVVFTSFTTFSFSQVNSTDPGITSDQSLKVLSWNIHLLPRAIKYTGQCERAELIGRQLKDKDYDVIVFQEAFDKKARNMIWEKLKASYPYQEGPVNLTGSPLRTNGGVWMVSKYPMKKLGEIKYTVGSGFDAFARKGAMLVELVKNGKTYQVSGTHLQSDDGKKKDLERIVQYNEMINKLLVPFRNDTIPQIICGDFNISKRDVKHYNRMVHSIDPSEEPVCDKDVYPNAPVLGVQQYTWDYTKNDLIPSACEITTYDYILVRRNKTAFRQINRGVRVFSAEWKEHKKQKNALSDHFAMEIMVVPETPVMSPAIK